MRELLEGGGPILEQIQRYELDVDATVVVGDVAEGGRRNRTRSWRFPHKRRDYFPPPWGEGRVVGGEQSLEHIRADKQIDHAAHAVVPVPQDPVGDDRHAL